MKQYDATTPKATIRYAQDFNPVKKPYFQSLRTPANNLEDQLNYYKSIETIVVDPMINIQFRQSEWELILEQLKKK